MITGLLCGIGTALKNPERTKRTNTIFFAETGENDNKMKRKKGISLNPHVSGSVMLLTHIPVFNIGSLLVEAYFVARK